MTDALLIIPTSGSVSSIPKRVVGMIRHCYGLMLQDVLPAYYAFKLEGVSVVMQKLDGSVRALVLGNASYWPVLLRHTGGSDAGVFPISKIALFDTGDPVMAVNAPALRPYCVMEYPTWETYNTGNNSGYLSSREFMLWVLENKHFEAVPFGFFPPIARPYLNSNITFRTNGVASDFLHPFPSGELIPLYYAKEGADWYCYARLRQKEFGTGYQSVAAITVNTSWNTEVYVDIAPPSQIQVAVREYLGWVIFKYNIFKGVGVRYGNGYGTITTSQSNPVYTFEMFGQNVSLQLPNLAAAVADKPAGYNTPDDNIVFDSGVVAGVCDWKIGSFGTVGDGGVLSVVIQPSIKTYRGDAWVAGAVASNVYDGVPYSFGEFIDLREAVYPAHPERVFNDKLACNIDLPNRASQAGTIVESGISSDMWSGIYATFVEITTEQQYGRESQGGNFISEDYRNGVKLSSAGVQQLTATVVGAYAYTYIQPNTPFVGPTSSLDENWTEARKLYDMDGAAKADGAIGFSASFIHAPPDPKHSTDWNSYTRVLGATFDRLTFATQTGTAQADIFYNNLVLTLACDVKWPLATEYRSTDMGITVVQKHPSGVALFYKNSLVAGVEPAAEADGVITANYIPEIQVFENRWAEASFSNGARRTRKLATSFRNTVTEAIVNNGPYNLYGYADIPSQESASGAKVSGGNFTYVGHFHRRYLESLPVGFMGAGYFADYGFMYWRNAVGSEHGIVAQEIYCDADTKNYLLQGVYFGIAPERSVAAEAAAEGIDYSITDSLKVEAKRVMDRVNGYSNGAKASFLAEMSALTSYVAAIEGDATNGQIAAIGVLKLAALRASYSTIVNNFASQKLLDFAVPRETLIVAPYEKPATYQ